MPRTSLLSRQKLHGFLYSTLAFLVLLFLTCSRFQINPTTSVLESNYYGSYSGGVTGIYSWYPAAEIENGAYAWDPTVEIDRTIWPNGLDPPDYSGPFAVKKRNQMLSLDGVGRNFNPDDIGFGGMSPSSGTGSSRASRPHLLPYDPYSYASVNDPTYGYGTFARHAGPGGGNGGARYLYGDGYPLHDAFQQYAADAQNSQYALDQARYANWSRAYEKWSAPPPPGADNPRWSGETPAWYRVTGRRSKLLLRGAAEIRAGKT